jgi:hypothetical protein
MSSSTTSPPTPARSSSTSGNGSNRALRQKQLAPLLVDLGNQIAAFLDQAPTLPPGSLVLSAEDCRRLEETVGLATTVSPAVLLAAIERLAAIRVGDIRLPFTPGQLAELQHRASKRGRSIEQEIRAVVDRIRDEIFHRGG